jgi:hypothetical protein
MTIPNMSPMCCWLMLHPKANPPHAEKKAISTMITAKVNGEPILI